MRVLLAHNRYAKESGEEHAFLEISRLLESNGNQVEHFLKSSDSIRRLADKALAFLTGIHSFSARREMAAILDRQAFDLVHVQNLYPFLSPAILEAVKQRSLPLVMRCPNYRLFCPNGLHYHKNAICERCLGAGREIWCVLRNCEKCWPKSVGYALRNAIARIRKTIVRNVDVFIVLSEFQKKRFMEGGVSEKKIEILPNVVPLTNGCAPEPPGKLATFCGRVTAEKGILEFLEAARALPDIPFAVAGAIPPATPWRASSPANVEWLGFLDEDALNRLYLNSRMLVFPSKCFEGFPNVITRAMALARPVIASRLGGLPEIVEDGRAGMLFRPGDVSDLVSKIRDLYANLDLCAQLGRQGRDKAKREYSEEAVYRRLMEIYRKASSLNSARALA